MGENICSRTISTRSNSPDKLANLNYSIRCQLMQLHPEHAQNVQKDWVRRHTETSSEENFEHHCFIFMRNQNRLCTKRSAIPIWKVMSETLQRCKTGLHNGRLPKIIAHASKSSHDPNLHMFAIVGGSFAIIRAFRLIFSVRPSTLLRNSFCRDDSQLVSKRFFRLFSWSLPMLRGDLDSIFRSHGHKFGWNDGSSWACNKLNMNHARSERTQRK
jgi:hypothetical protein